ncbi:MAG: DUF917 family protein [Tissierellia bacterium]|nr:DUF917 family protein [Tissierellia bacterium]
MDNYISLNEELLEYALIGGTILGGGGGGSIDIGRRAGRIALDYTDLKLYDISVLDDDDLIATVSAVGAPAAVDQYIMPSDYIKTVQLLEKNTNQKISGIITNENGGAATINGWIQSAILNIPLIDAPCNGRAHPTGKMGSMNLDYIDNFESYQTFSGGNPEIGNNIEGFIKGDINKAAKFIRQASIYAGGLVAVARNPINAKYVKENAALNGIKHAIELGNKFSKGLKTSPAKAFEKIVSFLDGEIITEGIVSDLHLSTEDGFDVGNVKVGKYELTFWNEYMTLDNKGQRLYTFPDLIMTFDKYSGKPITTAEIQKGQDIVVIATDKSNIKLGSTMFNYDLLAEVEKIIDKDIVNFNL